MLLSMFQDTLLNTDDNGFKPAVKKRWLRSFGGGILGLFIGFATGCGGPADKTDLEVDRAIQQGLDFIGMYDLTRARRVLAPAYAVARRDHPSFDSLAYAYALSLWHYSPGRANFVEEAQAIFLELLERVEDENLRRLTQLDLGRLYEVIDFPGDIPDVENARILYRAVYDANQSDDLGQTALLFLANSFFKEYTSEASVREGIRLLTEHLELHPDGPMSSLLWQRKGDVHIDYFGEADFALDAYLRAAEIGFVDLPRADLYLWNMATWADQLGRYDETVQALTQIVEENPRSLFGTFARNRIIELSQEFPERQYRIPELQTFGAAVD
jgi:tetratricopeptide (TPR) repeat protein